MSSAVYEDIMQQLKIGYHNIYRCQWQRAKNAFFIEHLWGCFCMYSFVFTENFLNYCKFRYVLQEKKNVFIDILHQRCSLGNFKCSRKFLKFFVILFPYSSLNKDLSSGLVLIINRNLPIQ